MIIVLTAVLSATLAWVFSEITHRRSAQRKSANEIALLHKTEQVKILNELQEVVLRYYSAYSKYVWAAWGERHATLSKRAKSHLEKSWQEMEDLALKLFALSAKVDDLMIRAKVDMLEEIARWNTVSPGVDTEGGAVTDSKANILEDDQSIQRRAITVNLSIGDRQLELLGSHNPEEPPRG